MDEFQRSIAKFGITVNSTPERGRGLYTTRAFSPGELIFTDDAYSCVPDNHISDHQCDGCLLPTNNVCPGCKFVYFCSAKCQRAESKLHSPECRGLARLRKEDLRKINSTLRLAIKIQIKAKLQALKTIATSPLDSYTSVKALVFHEVDKGGIAIEKAKQVCSVAGGKNFKEVAQILLRIIFNSSSILDVDLGHLGKGLYTVVSLMNHSCQPNTIVVFEGKKAFVRCVERIAEGAEITQSYINVFGSTMSRRAELEGLYMFICKCPCCTKGQRHDILENAYLYGYRCSANGCDGALLSNSDGVGFICQKCKCLRTKEETTTLETEIKLQRQALRAAQTTGSHNSIRFFWLNT